MKSCLGIILHYPGGLGGYNDCPYYNEFFDGFFHTSEAYGEDAFDDYVVTYIDSTGEVLDCQIEFDDEMTAEISRAKILT